MSKFAIEDLLLSAAGDGGSVPFRAKPPAMDAMDLFNAWTIERDHGVECEMLLSLSRAAIVRLLETEKEPSARKRRSALALIRQIDHRLGQRPTDRT